MDAIATDIPDTLKLVDHPTARNAAVATRELPIGTVVLTEPVLTSVLFSYQTGRRCDYCNRSDQAEPELRIRKCTGCEVQGYCGELCQKRHWDSGHKLICRVLFRFMMSDACAALPHDQEVDCRVLSQLVAEIALQRPESAASIDIFESLLPSPHGLEVPPIVPMRRVDHNLLSRVPTLYQRFPNNNHVVQNHLRGIGVAILPLTSRLLNHSCSPNAVLRYILSASEKPRAEVVTIREISEGEEVSIPYLDPAISYPERQNRLKDTYGFDCSCKLCTVQSSMDIHPVDATQVLPLVDLLDPMLCQLAFGEGITIDFQLPEEQLCVRLPEDLQPLMDDSILSVLTERFRLAFRERFFEAAMTVGKTIFAIYLCIYPPYYPQIGVHVLDMAQVAWEKYLNEKIRENLDIVSIYLAIARRILDVYGREGDSGGPLDEANALLGTIQSEEQK
ncbi:SET domain-containing protein [Thelephora ganbajun]|uniref:SET domain-containing protein n=1 Tax=Thelephora ganbajun TaxID=370292 RepID=A0ACB6Z168_THEGA|nr:SET domain-containing protein [Thelephora ganbajun]